MDVLSRALTNDANNYPETLRGMRIINAPKIFTLFWKIFKPILDPDVVAKTEIYGNNYLDALLKDMPIESIPKEFGGKCKCAPGECIRSGGKWSDSPVGSNDPKKFEVFAGKKHEEEIVVEIPGTKIGWEFSTDNYDIEFLILSDKHGEILPKERFDSQNEPVVGQIDVTEIGTYKLVWDNSFSMFRKKNVTALITLTPPLIEEKKKKKKKKSKKNLKKTKDNEEDQEEKDEPEKEEKKPSKKKKTNQKKKKGKGRKGRKRRKRRGGTRK